jgi:hypothetical protein
VQDGHEILQMPNNDLLPVSVDLTRKKFPLRQSCNIGKDLFFFFFFARHVDNFSPFLDRAFLSSSTNKVALSLLSCSVEFPSFSKEMVLIVAPSKTPISALLSGLCARVGTLALHPCADVS